MRPLLNRCCLIGMVLVLISTGCASAGAAPIRVALPPVATATFEPLQTVAPEANGTTALAPTNVPAPAATEPPLDPTSTPAPKPGRGFIGVSVATNAPLAAAAVALAGLKAAGIRAEQVVDESDLQVVSQGAEGAAPIYERVFTPVDRMSSVLDSITLEELRGVWTGQSQTPNFTNIFVSEDDVSELAVLLGQPAANVKPVPASGVEAAVWGDKMGLGILPFDKLTVKMRAIKLDAQTPVDNRFQPASWPLTARAYLMGNTDKGRSALSKATIGTMTNRDANKLTVLVMTGVTAMARNSGVAIERSGDWGFLARQVGPELAAADITIISNEIPFMPDCVADNIRNNLLLCSKPEY